jgi:hypothetical protein
MGVVRCPQVLVFGKKESDFLGWFADLAGNSMNFLSKGTRSLAILINYLEDMV